MKTKQPNCKDLVNKEFEQTFLSLKNAICNDELCEFGLCYDYTENANDKYIRYLMSYGGPSDELRFYVNRNGKVQMIEYWYMDWYDGAKITIVPNSEEWKIAKIIFEFHGGSKNAEKMIVDYDRNKFKKTV